MMTKNALENVVWFLGGMVVEIAEVDNFVDCFKAIRGDPTASAEEATGAVTTHATETNSLAAFFSNLVTVVEFLCFIKDKLIGFFTAENKRLRMIKKHKKMNFIEKRRTMTEAMRKKSWGDMVNWVKSKAGQVKAKISEVADKVTTWATATWETIKENYQKFKKWVKDTWEKVKGWFAKAKEWIEKFNGVNACYESGKSLASGVAGVISKVKEFVTNIVGRVTTISTALAGNPAAIATVVAGVICAIPHIVKMVEYYKNTTWNAYFKWGKIVARAGKAFTA